MRFSVAAVLAASLILSACAGARESRLNPFNWFSRSEERPVTLAPEGGFAPVAQDNRGLVANIAEMEIIRVPGGALINVRGQTPTQGWWDPQLVPLGREDPVDRVLTYRFIVAAPRERTRVSTPQSREVTAARFVSDQTLQGVSRITVLGGENSRSSRR